MLNKEKIEKNSGYFPSKKGIIETLKKGYWKDLHYFPGGDAPKSFIALYSYERKSGIRKKNWNTWPKYIAKVGHKWYPIESINEYLFNQIGEVLGLNMAKSKIVLAGDQIRFLSRYFLSKDEQLEHGAQLFAAYLVDKELVEDIENQGFARSLFTFQFAENAILNLFPEHGNQLLQNFVKMLVFDAITGNNDRHFYNWGIITHIEKKKSPSFAPIYDSARGLFWNFSESHLVEKWLSHPKHLDGQIKKYAFQSKPKIGWDGLDDLNHFELIQKIQQKEQYKLICKELLNDENKNKTLNLIRKEFYYLLSKERRILIENCLKFRFEELIKIIE